MFGSITVEVAAPEAVSSHPSSIYVADSELKIGADCASQGWTVGRRPRSRNLYGDRVEYQPSPLQGP